MWPALIFLGACMGGILYGINSVLPHEATYNCELAEISPDIPLEVKEKCRQLRKETK